LKAIATLPKVDDSDSASHIITLDRDNRSDRVCLLHQTSLLCVNQVLGRREMYNSVSELIETLETMVVSLRSESTDLIDKIAVHIKGSQDEDCLLNICADLQNHSHQLSDAVQFIRDWNSRNRIPC
jgi:hypothetical protein